MKLNNLPSKGTADWFPEELKIRQYIFDKWRTVCQKFGYEEYLTPIFESADIYKAKSGEDIGGKELMIFKDKAERELAIRPEMTPSVTRMITRRYNELPKPIRYFSIANFVRNEKPQRGRNREFWQLNADIFGSDSVNADLEILVLAIELMLAFNPKKESFCVNISSRKLIDGLMKDVLKVSEEEKIQIVRIMDKYSKLTPEDFDEKLTEVGLLEKEIKNIRAFLDSNTAEKLVNAIPEIINNEGYTEVSNIISILEKLGYKEWLVFNPSIIRGFDYYDGMVFEVMDKNPQNNRSLFGGGRYNGLAELFGDLKIPAVGFAPGDETMKLFLEAWDIIPESIYDNKSVYIPLLVSENYSNILRLSQDLRKQGVCVVSDIEVKQFGKALNYANNKGFEYVVIVGEDEIKCGKVSLKNMRSGEQILLDAGELVQKLKEAK